MKKGIDCHPDYDENGRWCLKIKKAKGHFTVDELQDVLEEYEMDYYAVIIKALGIDGEQYFDDVQDPGDFIIAYRATDFMRRAPAADVVGKTGKWVKISPAGIYECNQCGQNVMTADIEAYKFCHGCGAKMEVPANV